MPPRADTFPPPGGHEVPLLGANLPWWARLQSIGRDDLAPIAGTEGPPGRSGDRVLHEADVPVGEEDIGPRGMRAGGGPGALLDEPAVGTRVVVDPQHVVVHRVAEPVARPVEALVERSDLRDLGVQAVALGAERIEV